MGVRPMDNNAMKNPGFIVSVLLLIGFFLPWINVVIISFSGFDLATVPFRGIGGGEAFLALALWLIPICSILGIVFTLRGNGPVRGMVFIASLVVILAFVVAIIA